MKNTLHNMMSAMETQNLIYQVPVPLPVDQVAEAHSCVISAIQQDMSGLYSKEEKGQVINYIITNPAADSMYELLSDDELAMPGFRQPFPSKTLSSHAHHVCLSPLCSLLYVELI